MISEERLKEMEYWSDEGEDYNAGASTSSLKAYIRECVCEIRKTQAVSESPDPDTPFVCVVSGCSNRKRYE